MEKGTRVMAIGTTITGSNVMGNVGVVDDIVIEDKVWVKWDGGNASRMYLKDLAKITEEPKCTCKFGATISVDISLSHEKKIAIVMTKADLETLISIVNWSLTNGNTGMGPKRIAKKLEKANNSIGFKVD